MALNSLGERCCNVFSAALCFICNEKVGLWQRFLVLSQNEAQSSRLNIGAMFPEGIQQNLQ